MGGTVIGVVGAGGRVGRLVVARLVARSLPVAAIVREPARATGLPPGVAIRKAGGAGALSRSARTWGHGTLNPARPRVSPRAREGGRGANDEGKSCDRKPAPHDRPRQ
jgi:hypothetical protein